MGVHFDPWRTHLPHRSATTSTIPFKRSIFSTRGLTIVGDRAHGPVLREKLNRSVANCVFEELQLIFIQNVITNKPFEVVNTKSTGSAIDRLNKDIEPLLYYITDDPAKHRFVH